MMSNNTTGDLKLIKPELDDDIYTTIGDDLPVNFDIIDKVVTENRAAQIKGDVDLDTKINTDISNVTTKIDENITIVNNRIDDIIIGSVEGVSAQEIIDARKGYTVLGGRLNNIDEQLSHIIQPLYSMEFNYSADWSGVRDDNTDSWSYDLPKIKTLIDDLVTKKVKSIALIVKLVYVNGTYKIAMNTSLISQVIDYAQSVDCPVTFLKVHQNDSFIEQVTVNDSDNAKIIWSNFIDELIMVAKNTTIKTLTIMNETSLYTNTSYDSFIVGMLNKVHANGFKTGVTCGGSGQVEKLTTNAAKASDYVFFNFYPSISWKGKQTTYPELKSSIKHALEKRLARIYTIFNKKVFISESGVMQYWESLLNPEDYKIRGEDSNGLTQTWYQSAMFETLEEIKGDIVGYNSWYDFPDNIIPILQKHLIGGGNYVL